MDRLTVKTTEEIEIMKEGGRKLAVIRDQVAKMIGPGMTTAQLDKEADELIRKAGGYPSFKMVAGYKHATCINVNDEVVHGVPGERVIQNGDKIGVDVGFFYMGFHTDTAVTVMVGGGKGRKVEDKFLETGKLALQKAIGQARPGKRVMDISRVIQETIEGAGYSAVRALTGHGIGKNLHEEPAIPCFVMGSHEHSFQLVAGMTVAIEVMYNLGGAEVNYKNDDGWTIATADGKISGLFEHTVAITKSGPVVFT